MNSNNAQREQLEIAQILEDDAVTIIMIGCMVLICDDLASTDCRDKTD